MTARLVAVVILVGLAIGVWALWPRGEPDAIPATTVIAAATTQHGRSSTTSTSTSMTETTTSATSQGSHVVTTVEEAEEILRELWFGWFEGIYHQDEERIRDVVGSQNLLENARAAFGQMNFDTRPRKAGTNILGAELLRADESCLAIWAGISADYRSGASDGVHVVRYGAGDWVLVSFWVHRNDLWGADCESELESLS